MPILMGLDALFGGNREAEAEWLDTPRGKLGGHTPREIMERGEFDIVSKMLKREMGHY